MELQLTTASGKASTKSIDVQPHVFDALYNESLIHEVVVSYMSGLRQGTKAQKNRSAVSGGGAKPWRQKGTGRARAGTIRSPLWRTGGVTFAASPRDHSKKVNKRAYRVAMRSIMSELVRQNRLVIVDKLEIETPKTSVLVKTLEKMGINSSVLIIVSDLSENLFYSSRNIPNVAVSDVLDVDPAILIAFEKVLITAEAVKSFEEQLS